MSPARKDLLTDLLRQVSRSFYLTMRVLPSSIRSQIGLAYLLARTTDTIADTELVPVNERLDALARLRDAILDFSGSVKPVSFTGFTEQQGLPAERVLLERVNEALGVFRSFDTDDQARIRQVLEVITSGQVLDLERFGGATSSDIVSLQTDAELDDYAYRVAGCVGEFWTRTCRAKAFPKAALDDSQLLADGIRFGKGLQLVNILRDLPEDLRQGRCYIPSERLSAIGLLPSDLTDARNEAKFRPLYDELLGRAMDHLTAGWAYTCALPWTQMRVRLACAWPVLIGVKTLSQLSGAETLGSGTRVKVSRRAVKGLMARTILLYPLPAMWQKLGPYRPQTGRKSDALNES